MDAEIKNMKPSNEVREKMNKIAEQIFGTQNDPNQIPINVESRIKLDTLTNNWLVYELAENGDPISWIVVVPTTKELAAKFLEGKMNEKQILDLTTPQEKYSALYLCSAITVPEYRHRGFAEKLLRKAIQDIPKTDDCVIFAWPFSEAGEGLVKKLKNEIQIKTPH